MATILASDYANDNLDGKVTPIPLGALTAAGVSDELKGDHSEGLSVELYITGMGTNVVYVLEGSINGVRYWNLHDEITRTTNGTFGIRDDGKLPYYRLRLVSFSGGTPVINVNAYFNRIS